MKTIQLIQGGVFEDNRGKFIFANDFDLTPIQRLYHIHHPDTEVVRAWQGHKVESKWFHCIKSSFDIKLAPIHKDLLQGGDYIKKYCEIYQRNLPNAIMVDHSSVNLPEIFFTDLGHLNYSGASYYSTLIKKNGFLRSINNCN